MSAQTTVTIYAEPAYEEKACLRALDQYADSNGEVELEFECGVAPPEDHWGANVEEAFAYVQIPGKRIKLADDWSDDLFEHYREEINEAAIEQLTHRDER